MQVGRGVATLALAFWLGAAAGGCAKKPLTANGSVLEIVTFNVNYHVPNPSKTVDAIADADADIVCLQETNPKWETCIRAGLSSQYPHMKFRHADGAGGVAILSKQPFEQVFYGRCVGIYPGWIVRAGSPIGPVQLAVLHLHPPMADMTIDTPYQRDELPQVRLCELQSYVRKLDADKATIVCGDFNTDDGGPALKWLASQGYTNALDRDPYTATWRGRRGLVPVRMRLDHIFAGPWLRCLHGRALHAGGSDHRPLLGRFERRSAGVRSR